MPPLAKNKGRFFALDTETTGVDLHHGAVPFFVSVCHEDGTQDWWEWDVDPTTRKVKVPREDAAEINTLLMLSQGCVLHNAKFDAKALVESGVLPRWDWEGVHDTLVAAHLLGSNQPKDLTSLALTWLARDIQPLEDALQKVVTSARSWVRSQQKRGKLLNWRIVKKGNDDSPSAKDKTWKHDCWLPRAIGKLNTPDAKYRRFAQEWLRLHPNSQTVLRDYANADSAVTMALWWVMRRKIEAEGLWQHYLDALKVLPVLMDMETRGVTVNKPELIKLRTRLRGQEQDHVGRCLSIAAARGYDLKMPKGGRNASLERFVFEVLKLEPIYSTKAKTAKPSLDSKNAIPHWLDTLEHGSDERAFVEHLAGARQCGTHAGYLDNYERYLLPMLDEEDKEVAWCLGAETNGLEDWYVLHPNINPTGTDTLRRSHSNPNSANVSKHNEANLRACFGPAPGREWWTFDAQNLELRLPAYEANEEDMIKLFERPSDPPYFGSVHALMFHAVYPKDFEALEANNWNLKKYVPDKYRTIKGVDFAKQYRAGKRTVDLTAGFDGAYEIVTNRFPALEVLNHKWVSFADKRGYVETMPVNGAKRGYPLLCSRTTWGGVKPTVPLNYHVQGTAGEWMRRAMVRVHAQLAEWRRDGFDSFICLEVHDELVVDMPKGPHPTKDPRRSNLPRARKVAELMEMSGKDIGVPTPVSVEWHPRSWDKGVTLR